MRISSGQGRPRKAKEGQKQAQQKDNGRDFDEE
jgi:hypothetical protein